MRGFWLGLLVGVAVGGAGVYLGLRKPWRHAGAGVQAAARLDAGPASDTSAGARHHRRHHRGRGQAGGGSEDQVVTVSPEDLVLVWRGPAVALPRRDVDMGAGGGGRALDQSEIDAGIRAHAGGVLDCIKQARGDAEMQSTITLEMLVDGQGRVEKSRVRAPVYLMRHGLETCVRAASRSFHFAATGAPTVVTVPFDLS